MLIPRQAQTTDAKNALQAFRALALSRKQPATVKQLFRDYKELVGHDVTYRKFGYDNLDDFLVQSGEFVVHNFQGEMYLTARPNKDSEHIRQMIKYQKESKNSSSSNKLRKPIQSDQSWNKSSYSKNVFQKLPSMKKLKNTQSLKKNNNVVHNENKSDTNNNSKENNRNITTDMQHEKTKEQKSQATIDAKLTKLQDRLKSKQKTIETAVSQDANLLHSNFSIKHKQIVPNNTPNGDEKQKSLRTTSNTISQRAVSKLQEQLTKNNLKNNTQSQKKQQQQEKRLSDETANRPTYLPVGKGLIQDRLKLVQECRRNSNSTVKTDDNSSISMESNSSDSRISISRLNTLVVNETEEIKEVTFVPPDMFNSDSLELLKQYCICKNIPLPAYKCLKSCVSNKLHGRVIVNCVTYSTYPDEFDTEFEANLASAKKAIEEIKKQEIRLRYPICTDSDGEIVLKIYELVEKHPCGIFQKNIPEKFEEAYEKLLPDNWFSILQESNLFTIEMTVANNIIVLAKKESIESNSDVIIIDRISLPWENKLWNLLITNCPSTIEVWARIVDKDYNNKFDSLMNDIDVYMLTEKTRPISIVCGQIYLISISECWHRVRVEEMNKDLGKCLCYFVDFGDEEWQPMEELYVCEPRFLVLPPQAVCFSLFGLEDFAGNPNAKKHLDTLLGKPFVGEILTKQENYESDDETNSNTKIQLVLYDTSTKEDVNLNPILLENICNDAEPPELKRNGVNNVFVTHVLQNGELYVQLRSSELQYVQKLIQQLVESKFNRDLHKVNKDDMKRSRLLFIQDPDDNHWYRGALVENENENETYKIFYVDYGITKDISIDKIFRLDSLSAALSKFPRQAIKVKLYKLPPVNNKIIGLILGLLPAQSHAIVKVAVNAIVPQVIVYKRFDDKEGLFNVNESIQIEYELESSNDIVDATPGVATNITEIQSSTFDVSSVGVGSYSLVSSMRALSLRSPMTVPFSQQKELPKLLENCFVPEVDKFFHVIVTMASNPSNFTVRPYNDGPKLTEMMNELKAYCSSNDEFIPFDMIEVGQAYAAHSSDGFYYRVIVENVFKSMDIHVHYCDFGGLAVLSNDKLKILPAKFRTLPKQAIAAKLSNIKPIHGDWTLQDCIRFQELTVNQKFASIIKKISDDPVVPGTKLIEMELIDVQTDDDIYIHQIMINEKRAISIV